MKDGAGTPIRQESDYVYYALPRTVLTVDLPVVAEAVDTDVPCFNSAYDDLRDELLLKKLDPGKKFKLDEVTIGSRTEADPTRVYAIDLRRSSFHKFTSTFEITESGLLGSADVADENQTVDFAVGVVKAAAGLAVKGMSAGLFAADIDVGEQPTARKSKDPKRVACERVADAITLIRTTRDTALTSSIKSTNADIIDHVLDKFDEREAALAANFIGEQSKKVLHIRCEVIPTSPSDVALFQLDTANGVSHLDEDRCIAPAKVRGGSGGDVVALSIPASSQKQFSEVVDAVRHDDKTLTPHGLFYRVPASASVVVKQGTSIRTRQRMAIAQFGTVNSLPSGADTKTFQSAVVATLYPASGGLQKLAFGTQAVGTSAVTGTADALGTILDARAAKKTAEAAAKDELTQLERQRKILEEKKKIADLEAALAPPKP